MSRRVFREIFVHTVWHTKNSAPLTCGALESRLYEVIRHKCQATDGVFFQGIGSIESHVHVVIGIEPSILLGNLIGQVKGASSRHANQAMGEHFDWQQAYGIVSVSKRDLPRVLNYVANQNEHHRNSQLSEKREYTDEPDSNP